MTLQERYMYLFSDYLKNDIFQEKAEDIRLSELKNLGLLKKTSKFQ